MSELQTDETIYCHYHPDTESTLRCNRCSKPICPKCAVRVPTGYRCRECVREQQDQYFNAERYDSLIGFATGGVMGLLGYIGISLILALVGGFLGFFTYVIIFFAAPAWGGVIAEVLRRLVQKRRGRYLAHWTIGGIVAAALIPALLALFFGNIFGLLSLGLYTFLASSAVYARIRGISV